MDVVDWETAVLCDWRLLEVAPWELRSSRDILLEVVRSNGLALQYASADIRRDPNVALEAVIRTEAALLHCDIELREDADFVLEAVKGNSHVLDYASELLGNHGFMLKAVQLNWKAIELAVEELRAEPDIVFAAAMTNVKALSYSCEELLDDHKFMHSIVKLNWKAISYASEKVRGKKDVVLSGVKQDWHALQSAAPALLKDVDFVIETIQANRETVPYSAGLHKENRTFWVQVVKAFPDGVGLFVDYYGEGELQKDAELMTELTKKDWRAFLMASPELRALESLQLLAVRQCWEAVKGAFNVQLPVMEECVKQRWKAVELFLDPKGPRTGGLLSDEDRTALANSNPHIVRAKQLADDDVAVTAAVKNSGPCLKFASVRLQAHRGIATAAIRQNWRALEFASEKLRGDKKLIMVTLKQCGLALQHATENLRADHSVVLEAIVRHKGSLQYMSTKLHKDELFWATVCRRFSDGYKMAAKYGMSDMMFANSDFDCSDAMEDANKCRCNRGYICPICNLPPLPADPALA